MFWRLIASWHAGADGLSALQAMVLAIGREIRARIRIWAHSA